MFAIRPRAALVACALLLAAAPAAAGRLRPPQRVPSLNSLFSAGPIAPNGLLIRDGETLRTLELDELAPAHVRFTIHF